MGRPTKYNEEILTKAREYIDNYTVHGDLVPSIAGLACAVGAKRSTMYEWAASHDEVSDILDEVKEKQEKLLLSGGLSGDFNSNIVKLMLGKHGYSDKHDVGVNAMVNINVRADGFGRFGS